jgi:hypothetical protein
VTHERNQDRVVIVWELSNEVRGVENRNITTFSYLNGLAFITLRNRRNIISLLANFDIPNRHKTISILFRGDTIGGPGFLPIAAINS